MSETHFNDEFDQHGAWRREFGLRLKLLAEWLKDNDLLNSAVAERLLRLESQIRSDKVMVAFVAEFSRGKSELINAIFFAGYKRRIMPASAGRTTMCPTELGYDPEVPACLRLLPIESRLTPQSLLEWRQVPERWHQVELDVNDPGQLAASFERVAEVNRVTLDEAGKLGFWHDDTPDDNPMQGADGLVEVPRWRHALVNVAHPLLRQGLVILDTPGLNAIGAEPELTVSLIPQAQAVVFILAADTGVTKSDLSIWREHVQASGAAPESRVVVLNKVDTMWDSLRTPDEVQAQIERQRSTTAEVLGLSKERVMPVSAQKGLIAKVQHDAALLEASGLPALERVLAEGVMTQRQGILRQAVVSAMSDMRLEAQRALSVRKRDVAEQVLELNGLRGKNAAVIKHMQARIEQEQAEFAASASKIQAMRSVQLRLVRELFAQLSTSSLRGELAELTEALRQPGIKLGVRKPYAQTFSRLRENVLKTRAIGEEIHSMLSSSYRQLNADYGFSLQVPPAPDLASYVADLDQAERSHLQYLGVTNVLRLAQADFTERLIRALSTRLRVVYESALSEIELWSKSVSAQLDSQVRERRRSYVRRIEGVGRIVDAATGLEDRLTDLRAQDGSIESLSTKLGELTGYLMEAPRPKSAALRAA